MSHKHGVKNDKHTTPSSNPIITPLVGAHQSIAGGLHLAFDRATSVGCRTLQIFTKSSDRWHAKPLTVEDIASYKTAESKSSISPVIAHDSYLINLCAKDEEILRKSREGFADELRRCHLLGIRYLNFHPGAHMGAGEKEGIQRIIESLNYVHCQTDELNVLSVLETTAGQGTTLGYRFEQLREIIDGVEQVDRMAVCIDTCHIFAAGYDISTRSGYEHMIREFDAVVGFGRLAVIHVNDSRKPLGSRVDRHEHIGKGEIGIHGFQCLMQDARLTNIPKILETPKGEDLKEDRENLATLRELSETRERQ